MSRIVLTLLVSLCLGGSLGAEELPPLGSWSLEESVGQDSLKPWAWGVAIGSGGLGVGLAAWGLGAALSELDSPSGPPLATTTSVLAWSTVLIAAAGLALEYALQVKDPPSDPE